MKKKMLSLLITIPSLLVLTACSSLNIRLPWVKATTTASNAQNQSVDFSQQPVESKLAIGILKLEGTDLAVTADQAKTLLPLWEAVKSLATNTNTTTEEMNGLYQQIEDSLNAEQLDAIKNLDLKPEDMQALMQQFGVQFPQRPQNGEMPNVQGTPQANSRNQSQGGTTGGYQGGEFQGGPGGFTGGSGGPPGGFEGGMPGDFQGRQGGGSSGQTVQGTPRARPTGMAGRAFGGGINNMFIDPLIKVLQERAAS